MKKLALKVEELEVESFRTADADADGAERGTVHGHYGTNHTDGETCHWKFFTCDWDCV